MEKKQIVVDQLVTGHKAVTPDEGAPIYKLLMESLNKGEHVVLSFSGLDMMTTAFLNVVIGDLYKTYTSEDLRSKLELTGLDEGGMRRVKKVTDRAKSFYHAPDQYSEIVNSVLDGKA